MLYSLQKTFCLHSQYEFASFLSLFLSVRHERHIGNFTREFALLGFLVKVYYRVLLTGICGIVAAHFVCALLDVDFADCHPVCKRFAFGKYRAAFRNEVMPRKNHVRSGFSFARVCIDVTAIESSRKRLYQQTAVCALAYHFVACRKIEYYSCALRYKVARGRISHPHIFAYLYAERIVLVISIYEYGLSERTISSRNSYLRIYNTLSGREVPCLVKLTVVGDIYLGYYSENFSFVCHYSTIEKFSEFYQRRADCKYDIVVFRVLKHVSHSFVGTCQKPVL